MTEQREPRFRLLATMALAIVVFGACSPATSPSPSVAGTSSPDASVAPSTAANEPVTISVGVLRPGATQEAADALNLQISQFQEAFPWITIESEEYNWTGPGFTAMLAGGTLPDVFTIPFTDGKGLIAQHQIVNIDSRVRALPYADEFNPNVLVNGQDDAGGIWAVPIAAYGMSLTYNRTLFEEAGLDPDQPPTTWDEVREYAKTIAEETGQAGFAEMATQNTGGWQLTTATYARGGRMQAIAEDGKVTATVNNEATKAALQYLKDLRWTDNSMGSTFDYHWGSINQAFASGQIGMFTGGSDLYTAMVQSNELRPEDYGIATIPLDGTDAGVLGGGTLAAVNVNTTEAQRDAAVTWIDWYYIRKLNTQEGAVADAEALKANNQPVGVPALPIFDKATYDQSLEWVKDFINVPTDQMTAFTDSIFDQPLVNEPTVRTQDLYAALDPVVQAVLTDQNANIDALLDAANAQIQALIDQG